MQAPWKYTKVQTEFIIRKKRQSKTQGNMSDDDNSDSDADDRHMPNLGLLQEGLSESTLAALLQFLPRRKFDEDDEEEGGNESNAVKDSTVCVAYTANDVNVIAETFKRLQDKNKELEIKKALAVEQRVLLRLEATLCSAIGDTSVVDTLIQDGVVRLNSILNPDICDRMRLSVNEHLGRDTAACVEQTQAVGYGNVLCRENRWDLYQRNDSVCNEALKHMLASPTSALSLLFQELFTNPTAPGGSKSVYAEGGAQFHELSVLVSDPGAASQPIHPDSVFTLSPPMYTVFVALQDIDESMGPTIFLPRTNTEDCHKQHKNVSTKDSFLATCEYRQALLKKGDAAIMDSRTLHCGDANLSARRMLLYFTIRNPSSFYLCDPPIPVGSKWANLELNLFDLRSE